MAMRRLGTSDLVFEPIVFGGNVFGWTADEATSFALIDRFVERGFAMIDTADVYSIWVPGHRVANRKPSSANGWSAAARATGS